MKPMPDIPELLEKRSASLEQDAIVHQCNGFGIKDIVNQQFEAARQIIDAGLVPIIEPELDIHCPLKVKAKGLLQAEIS